jgi:hypothetical protein
MLIVDACRDNDVVQQVARRQIYPVGPLMIWTSTCLHGLPALCNVITLHRPRAETAAGHRRAFGLGLEGWRRLSTIGGWHEEIQQYT